MAKQLTFFRPTLVKRIKDKKVQEIMYGQYEAVMIVKENGFPVHRTETLSCAKYPVTDVECEDGSVLVFYEPVYYINCEGRG